MDAGLAGFLQQNGPAFEERLGADRWYLVALAALTSGNRFGTAGGAIYKYLTQQPEYATREKRQFLIRRLREALVKLVIAVGIPKSLESIISLAKEIEEPDNDTSFIRSQWTPEQLKSRGQALNDRIYQGEADAVFDLLKHQRDFVFAVMDVGYGLFLSDETVLPAVDGETILLASLVVQNTPIEIGSHTKGLRRLGLEDGVVDQIKMVSSEIAAFMRSFVPEYLQ